MKDDKVKLDTEICFDYSNINNAPIELEHIIYKGFKHFFYKFGLVEDNCIIDSKKHDFLIPINIRRDLNSNNKIIIFINPVILKSKREQVLQDIDNFIKTHGYKYNSFPLSDNFKYYTDKNKVISDFEEVLI
ncbi:MAG: hypothetical protein JXR64_05895 [Spirochaetales bacterium]|nr:hypothetical protein [Spirochaetales bacterium]